jgi:aminoglycoside/choline kinase family phosphotransferase
MQRNAEQALRLLFERRFQHPVEQAIPLPPSGSNRRYFRLQHGDISVIGAWNPDARENLAFVTLTGHFSALGFPVPDLLAENIDENCYLISDLGNTTLFSLLPVTSDKGDFDEDIMQLYRQVLNWLPAFQVKGAVNLPFEICYPRKAFDLQAMMWDLNYFKYYFLKYFNIPFDEQKLEDAFSSFTSRLLQANDSFFLYRDFQSRNIMICDDKPWFIDYQGGRRGAMQYDLASLLYDAKANIPFSRRIELLEYYLSVASSLPGFDSGHFLTYFYDFVVMRILQALGTYGFRGGVEKKPFFLQSLPFALNNLRWLANNELLPGHTPYLVHIIEAIIHSGLGKQSIPSGKNLHLTINSFSYKKGIPDDLSGHGGGFVFDCRSLPNPGRDEKYRHLSGLDKEVRAFLEKQAQVGAFLNSVSALTENAVANYLERGFNNLSISFGCTGGQHRSVYCAEKLARRLRNKFPVTVRLTHMENHNWPGNK